MTDNEQRAHDITVRMLPYIIELAQSQVTDSTYVNYMEIYIQNYLKNLRYLEEHPDAL